MPEGIELGAQRRVDHAAAKLHNKPANDRGIDLDGDLHIFVGNPLSLTLAKNLMGSSGARDAEHRIVLDDFMSTVEHEFHATEVSEGCPVTLGI